MRLKEEILLILQRLKKQGFEAYVVGGAVRDYLMGKKAHDFDIATNAKPNEIIKIFQEYPLILNGLKHGTVTVKINDDIYEITTYRSDGKYSNHRQPDSVIFVNDLYSDVRRRDFTINGLAFDEDLRIVDYVNGIEDINNRIIRTIGNPYERFNEDALRILRALRFKAILNFSIEEKTNQAIYDLYPLLDQVAKERKLEEFNKIIFSDNCKNVINEYSALFNLRLESNFEKDDDLIIRLCHLLIDNNLDYQYLKEMKYPKNVVRECRMIIENYEKEINLLNMCHFLEKSNLKICKKIITINKRYHKSNIDGLKILNYIIEKKIPYKTSMLNIKINELRIEDNQKSRVLNILLDKVINEEIRNNEEELKKEIRRICGNI